MAPVIHVISVIDVVDVDVVSFVPGARPVFRPRINETEPTALVLESGVSIHHNNWVSVNAKPVSAAKMSAEAVFRNAVAPIPPPFPPTFVVTLPTVRAPGPAN